MDDIWRPFLGERAQVSQQQKDATLLNRQVFA